jgi:hypothetical protein
MYTRAAQSVPWFKKIVGGQTIFVGRYWRGCAPSTYHGEQQKLMLRPGITECQVIQWFVKPGARVEQFDPICEVQSDKASVEVWAQYTRVYKLH